MPYSDSLWLQLCIFCNAPYRKADLCLLCRGITKKDPLYRACKEYNHHNTLRVRDSKLLLISINTNYDLFVLMMVVEDESRFHNYRKNQTTVNIRTEIKRIYLTGVNCLYSLKKKSITAYWFQLRLLFSVVLIVSVKPVCKFIY